MNLSSIRSYIFPVLLLSVWAFWAGYMTVSNRWGLLNDHWEVSLTMTGGSFIAGATAEGGAAVAFPVFTKALHIKPPIARTFGLMIQSVGMTMAAVVILARGIPILPKVILWVSLGEFWDKLLVHFL